MATLADRIRADFPALSATVHGRPLVYLDTASTAQKPRVVVEAVRDWYERSCANIHRGVHALSVAATDRHEAVREKARRFVGAASVDEIVFTHGTTEALNLVARSLGGELIAPGDEVLVSTLEHHANLVPWQMICAERGAALRPIPLDGQGCIDLERFSRLLSDRTRIVAVSHVSNALGTISPVQEIVNRAHAAGAVVVIDGAQAVPHLRVDVQELGCDFYCFSGHKLYGPTGTGVLYGRRDWLSGMPPLFGGGDMIRSVSFEGTTYADSPQRFEAGTPDLAGIAGLGAAIDYVESVGLDAILAWEQTLLARATEVLSAVPGLVIHGPASGKAAILSFTLRGVHPHDAGSVLDGEGIAVRTGHHCAEPLMRHLGVPGTVRASLAFYNTLEEIDALGRALVRVVELFS